jgi:3-hydroxyacyl-CoA dehydrogenase
VNDVAIVGAGLIGRAWASIFARAEWHVRLFDPVGGQAERCHALCREALEQLARHGLCDHPTKALARIQVSSTLEAAVDGVSLVQENGPEKVEVKQAIYAELDRLAPADAILASSTSAIVASKFTEHLAGRHRCLVAHPVNPPHLVPVVELCGAPWTSPDIIERARAIYLGIGQVPIIVKRELEGFILIRLQGALLTEAMTRAYVFADASAAGEVDHVERIIDSMFARAMSDGEPSEDQYHIARVISDVWLSNLLAWLTRRASASDVSKRLDLAVRLLIGDDKTS